MKPDKNIKDIWYYIVVQGPGTAQEQIIGFKDKNTKIIFVPAFLTKEEAQECFLVMPKDIMNEKYEVQAIIKEDLIYQAEKNKYNIFLMDNKGTIKEQIN